MALVEFHWKERWQFELVEAATAALPDEVLKSIDQAFNGSALDLAVAHKRIGESFGIAAKSFIEKTGKKVDLISSHGHTIFHRPDLNMTFQAGSGAEIAAKTGIDTICDLRSTDVALGGQGAPLVPLGEKALFPMRSAFLNLGGIANISIHGEALSAFDICPCNQMLNFLAQQTGAEYDHDGDLARSGKLDNELLQSLQKKLPTGAGSPFSLGREHFDEVRGVFEASEIPIQHKLHTAVEVITLAIGHCIPKNFTGDMMVTGGGAFNSYLMERIGAHSIAKPFVPNKSTVEFKEAIIFAFLGLLRWRKEPNCAASVTGADRDNIGGAIYAGN